MSRKKIGTRLISVFLLAMMLFSIFNVIQIKGGSGDINAGIVSSYQWSAGVSAGYPDAIRINNSEFYLVGGGSYIKTIRVYNNNGTIRQSAVSSLSITAGWPSFEHIPGTDKYVLARIVSNNVNIVTVKVDANTGIISSAIDNQLVSSDSRDRDDLLRVGDGIYVVVSRNTTGSAGRLETVHISNSGQIDDAANDSIQFDAYAVNARLCSIDSNTIAVVYRGTGTTGYLKTYNISATTGDITSTPADTWQFDSSLGESPHMINIYGTIYAIAYQSSADDGKVITLSIANSGKITKTVIDSVIFDTGNCYYPFLFAIDAQSVYGVTWDSKPTANDTGWVATMGIAANGTVSNSIIGSYEFESDWMKWRAPTIFVNKSYYLITYQGPGDFGYSKTVNISTKTAGLPFISNPYPADGSTGIPLLSQLRITVAEPKGNAMNIIWKSDSSGTWKIFGHNTSVMNGTYCQMNSNFSKINKQYNWSVTVTSGGNSNFSEFSFSTPNYFELRWTSPATGINTGPQNPLAIDVDGDGYKDIIYAGDTSPGSRGRVACISGKDGSVLWEHNITSPRSIASTRPLEAGDLNNDGNMEIVVSGYSGTEAIYAKNGTLMWANLEAGNEESNLILDTDGTGYPYVFITHPGNPPYTWGHLSKCYGTNGTVQKRINVWYPCHGGLSAADINNDGKIELVLSDRSKSMDYPDNINGSGCQAYDADSLTLLWKRPDILCSSMSAVLTNVSGGPTPEVVICNVVDSEPLGATIYILNGTTGHNVTTWRVPYLETHEQLAVYDWDGDGHKELTSCVYDHVEVVDLATGVNEGNLSWCGKGPYFANVFGPNDGLFECCETQEVSSGTGMNFWLSNHTLLSTIHVATNCSVVQDIDGDGYNELAAVGNHGVVRLYNTTGTAPSPLPRTDESDYSQERIRAGVFIPKVHPTFETNVYVVPKNGGDISVGDTAYVTLRCVTNQSISGWGFQSINFTSGVLNVNKVRTGHYLSSTDDYYIFQDNGTMYGRGTINNATGVIGGSWINYYWEATSDGGWINNTNRTVLNLSIKANRCGMANISIFSNNGQYFAFSGIPTDFRYHYDTIIVHPATVASFTATPYGTTQINLSIVKGAGANGTIVRGKLGSYPVSITDGTWGINTPSARVNQTGLGPSQHWYYRAWSWNGTQHLSSLANVVADAITSGAGPHIPTTYLISPKNQTIGVNHQPKCRIWANDTHGGTLAVNWYSSTDGSTYTLRQTNASVTANTTTQWNYTQATADGIVYYWKVTVYDGTTTAIGKFYFTTKGINPSANTNIYVIPRSNDVDLGNATSIRLLCNTTQAISGWGFESINFTSGVINVSKVRTGHYSPSVNDYYIFQDNGTMYGRGTINNATGVIGGSWINYYWEATSDGGWINNTNRTVINLTVQTKSCGRTNITLFSEGGDYFAFSGIPINFIYHQRPLTIHPTKVSSFTATAYGTTQINLSWVKGAGAYKTIVRGKLGSYPINVADGTWGANITAQKVNQTVGSGEHWYYRAWSWNETKKLRSMANAVADAATGGIATHVPTIYLISPKNQTIGVNHQPKCKIYANDTHGGTLAVNWYSSTDGSTFTHRQKNASVAANSTVQWNYTQATADNTIYYWKVTAYDGITNASGKYYFTTKSSIIYWHNISEPLYYNASGGGGLNFFSILNVTDAASIASLVGPRCTQVILWNALTQTWSEYIPGVSPPSMNFALAIGDVVGVEVTGNTTIPLAGHDSNSIIGLHYVPSAGGGLNWIGRTDDTNPTGSGLNVHASDISGATSPAGHVRQVILWNSTKQEYQEFIIGVDFVGGIHDFQITPGMAVAVEVNANVTLSQYGW